MTGLRPTNSISLPLLSVIIPAYNVAPYIRRCLDSVCGQSYPNLEIICVDDGSTDETFSILQEYAAKDSRIVLHHQNNAGQATARNWALDHAHGDFVIGADSDDYVALDCYEKAMHHMTDDVDMVIFPPHVIGHDHRRVDEVTKWFDSPFKGRFGLDGYTPSSLTNHVWNKIFRRSIIEKYHIRFPDGQWFEDIAFTLMYFSVIKWAYMMEEKLYYYLVRDASTSGLTLKKHKKLLGMFDVADFLYSFYKKNGLWKANLPQVERMLKYVSWAIDLVPQEQRQAALDICHRWIRKWKINKLFPQSWFTKKYYRPTKGEVILKKTKRLFYRESNGKLRICFLGIPVYKRTTKQGRIQCKLLGIRLR